MIIFGIVRYGIKCVLIEGVCVYRDLCSVNIGIEIF